MADGQPWSWASVPEQPAAVVHVADVPIGTFLESQDHQDDLIRELSLVHLSARFDREQATLPKQLATLISEILRDYADVRSTTRDQAVAARERGEDTVTLAVPVLPGMDEALRRWLRLLDEADAFCQQGALLTLAASPEVRRLRHWYVEAIVAQLPPPPDDHPAS